MAPMGKWPLCCTSRGWDSSIELELEWIGLVVAEVWARWMDGRMDRQTDHSRVPPFPFRRAGDSSRDLNHGALHLWLKFDDPRLAGDELWNRQAQNGGKVGFYNKFVLQDQGHSPPKTTGILTKVFWTSGLNLVFLTSMGDELYMDKLRIDTHTHTHARKHGYTYAGNDNILWPNLTSSKILDNILELKNIMYNITIYYNKELVLTICGRVWSGNKN